MAKALARLQKVSAKEDHGKASAQSLRLVADYLASFMRLHDLIVVRGLTPDQGLEGNIRKAVHSIESKVKDQGLAELTVIMLMVRRHEKDYLLRGDPQYYDQITARVREFGEQMQLFSLPASLQNDIMALWAGYTASIKTLIDGDARIKAERDNFRKIAAAIDAGVTAIAAEVTRDIGASQAETLASLSTAKKTVLAIGGFPAFSASASRCGLE